MADGRYRAARAGKWFTGIPPTGYTLRPDPETKRGGWLIEDAEESEVIRYAFACAEAGDNIEETTRKLNGRFPGYRGKRGGVGFATSTVGRWLRNTLYVGDGDPVQVRPAPGLPAETFVLPAPGLISRETWDAARVSLETTTKANRKRLNTGKKTKSRTYPLADGRLVHDHGETEANFSGFPRGGIRGYRCSHATTRYRERWGQRPEFDPCVGFGRHPVKKSVKLSSVNASTIESLLILGDDEQEGLVDFLRSPEAIANARAKVGARDRAADETADSLDDALAEHEALRVEEGKLAKRLGRISAEAADAALDDLEARKAANADRVARLESETDYIEGLRISIEDLMGSTVSLLGGFGSIDESTGEDLHERGLRFVERDALAVQTGERDDLSPETLEWLAHVVAAWDIRGRVSDTGDGYSVAFDGLPEAGGGAASQTGSTRRRTPA
jgi:hypothetical protein